MAVGDVGGGRGLAALPPPGALADTGDDAFLADPLAPWLVEAARFFEDFLVREDEHGALGSSRRTRRRWVRPAGPEWPR